jgi:hypothetical protein
MTIIGQMPATLNHPLPWCYLGLAIAYGLAACASWRLRHHLHAVAYIFAAILVTVIAAYTVVAW